MYGEVKQECDKVIFEAGFGEGIKHPFGHNLGLDIHERPFFTTQEPDGSTLMQPGHLFALEPAAYVEGLGGARIENMALVTEDGCEVLNTLSTELDFA